MRTRFNLATLPLENNRRFIVGSTVLGLVGVAALVILSVHAYQTWRANRELRTEISRLETQIRASRQEQARLRIAFKNPKTVELLGRASYLNALIEQRAFPWTKMFADLEQVLPPGVRVISVSPAMDKDGQVKVVLQVGAENGDQEKKFLQSLVSSPMFSNVRVTQESYPAKMTAGNGDKVLLALEAHYATT